MVDWMIDLLGTRKITSTLGIYRSLGTVSMETPQGGPNAMHTEKGSQMVFRDELEINPEKNGLVIGLLTDENIRKFHVAF